MTQSLSARLTFRAALLLLAASATPLWAEVKVNPLFSAGMVVQRDVPLPVWGTADAGEKVTVTLGDRTADATAETTAGADGTWRVTLGAVKVGAPYTLTVKGENTVTLGDVLAGDVWICSGQSNMAFTMDALKKTPFEGDLAAADFPQIRQGLVVRNPSLEPLAVAQVKWTACSPGTVAGFTAAGYYFARELHRELGVPIGLVHSSWGGTSAEVWTSLAAINTVPDFKERADKQVADMLRLAEDVKSFPARIAAWEQANGRSDPGNKGEAAGWAALDVDAAGWTPGKLATKWNKLGMPDGGVGWVRKEFVLPATPTSDLRLDLGLVDEQYVTVYVNGEKVAESGREAPEFYARYVQPVVPAAKLRAGKNVVAMRFVSHTGDRTPTGRRGTALGFGSVGLKDVSDDILVRVETAFAPLTKEGLAARPAVNKASGSRTSGALFNGMIHPLIPFAHKGVLWYQGEQDAGRARAYRTLLPLMINDWRSRWAAGGGAKDLPFIIQQLPNWQEVKSEPEEAAWAELREAQYLTTKAVPNTYLSVAIDLGEVNDVHPKNKRDVGKRLALVALEKVYGRPVHSAGPVFASMAVEGGAIRLKFATVGGLKSADGGPLKRFAICGADRKWVWAEARIEGDTVVCSSPAVPAPVAVRYAWANSPEGCNLTDSTGLPAMPFRTDEFPGVTDKNK